MEVDLIKLLEFDRICRSCLSKECELKSLELIPLEIHTFLFINTEQENRMNQLPTQICDTCFDKMQQINNFKQICQKSELKLLEIIDNYQSDICENDSYEIQQCLDIDEEDVKCNSEGLVSKNEQTFKCRSCARIFPKMYKLRKHEKHHATERNFHCLQCDKSFRVKDTLKLHQKRCHSGDKHKEICKICGKSVVNILAHLRTHNADKPFKCNECNKSFGDKYYLTNHQQRVHGDPTAKRRPFLCSICGKGSVSTSALKAHIQHMHTTGKRFTCPICNKSFKAECAVNSHVRYTHQNERRYQCDVCKKNFQTSTVRNIHMRIHTGERPFECRLCGKAFRQLGTLKTHFKVHKVDINDVIESKI